MARIWELVNESGDTSIKLRTVMIFVSLTLGFYTAAQAERMNPGAEMKIRTMQRNSGTPIEMNPRTVEHILYVQGNRRRTDERRVQRNALWPGGPRVAFYEPRGALIETCEGDTKKAFSLDLDNRTYAPIVLRQTLTADQIKSFQSRVAKPETPARPTMLHEITTVDRGERKQVFGYTARHVITTFKVTPLDSTGVPQETITDGWYVDLDTHISCDPTDETPREGTTYSAVRLMGALASGGSISASAPSVVQTTYIGKPEKGFPIRVRRTTRRLMSLQGATTEQVTTMESEVTELSTKALDPGLFEVPKNFRSVTQILPVPRVALWARCLAWGHYYLARMWELVNMKATP